MSDNVQEDGDVYVHMADALILLGIKNVTTLFKCALCGEIRYKPPSGRALRFNKADIERVARERGTEQKANAEIKARRKK